MSTLINSDDDLHRIFKNLDKNGDGQVSTHELKWLLDEIGAHTSLVELETVIAGKSLDYLDFWIFYDIFIRRNSCDRKSTNFQDVEGRGEGGGDDQEKVLEKDLSKSFRVFDMNNDGFISEEELQSTLSRLGLWEEGCGRNCRSMIEVYDTNSDGLLDFEEFKKMMLPTNS